MKQRQFTDICNVTAIFFAVIAFCLESPPRYSEAIWVAHYVRNFVTSLSDDRCCATDYRTFTEPVEVHKIVLLKPFVDYCRIYSFCVNHQSGRWTHICVRRKQLIKQKGSYVRMSRIWYRIYAYLAQLGPTVYKELKKIVKDSGQTPCISAN